LIQEMGGQREKHAWRKKVPGYGKKKKRTSTGNVVEKVKKKVQKRTLRFT